MQSAASPGKDWRAGERFDIRVRSALRDLAPSLFDRRSAHTPDPDLTLKNVAHLLATHPSPGLMINALRDPHLRALIIDIARVSPWVTRRLASDPFVLEEIIGSPHALRLPSSSHPPLPPNLHIYKQRQEVRSAIRYLLGFASLEELTTELSTLADGIIAEVFDRLLQESGVEIPLAVFAMGELGTRELMIDADVDLVFIAGENPGGRNAGVEQFAERFCASWERFPNMAFCMKWIPGYARKGGAASSPLTSGPMSTIFASALHSGNDNQ